jgi:cell division protein FtsN
MEQKKLLWILFSATLFLLVVVGAGIIWLYPQPEEQPAVATEEAESREAGADFDPVEWVRSEQKTRGLEERPDSEDDENFIVVYGDNGESETEEPTIITEDIEETTGESSAAGAAAERDATTQPVTAEKPRTESQTAPRSTQKPTRQQPAPAEPKTRTIRTTEYWIQTGSYTSRTRADKIKAELDRQGFTGRIMSKDVNGTLYYRVRIGPYQEKDEAEKFLSWVKAKEQFSGSYISQVYRNKTVVQ